MEEEDFPVLVKIGVDWDGSVSYFFNVREGAEMWHVSLALLALKVIEQELVKSGWGLKE